MDKKIALSDGEWKLMNLLWSGAPRTITQMVHDMTGDTGWSKHTIIKMLQRLEEKGAVRHEEGQRAKRYYPLAEQTSAVLAETESFLDRVYGGSLGLMMSAMVRANQLSQPELDELYRILRTAEEDQNG